MTTAGAMTPLTGYLRVNGGDTVARTIDAGNGILIDVDADGRVMGLEVIGRDDFFAACMDALRVLRVAEREPRCAYMAGSLPAPHCSLPANHSGGHLLSPLANESP